MSRVNRSLPATKLIEVSSLKEYMFSNVALRIIVCRMIALFMQRYDKYFIPPNVQSAFLTEIMLYCDGTLIHLTIVC